MTGGRRCEVRIDSYYDGSIYTLSALIDGKVVKEKDAYDLGEALCLLGEFEQEFYDENEIGLGTDTLEVNVNISI